MKKISIAKAGVSLALASLTALSLTPVVFAEPYGWSPQVDFSNQGPPACTDSKPDKAPVLLQPNHPSLPKKPKKGEVVLYWHTVPGANGYNVYYGLSPKNYIYTAPNLGNTNNFTVSFLANKTYYFAVQAKNGCSAGALSQEWAVRPGGGSVSLVANGFVPVQRQSTGTPKKSTVVVQPVEEPSPTKSSSVQGVNATAPPVYQQPVRSQTTTRVPTPTPQPQGSWWDNFFNGLLKGLGLKR